MQALAQQSLDDLELYRFHRARARRALMIGTALGVAGLLLVAREAFAQDEATSLEAELTQPHTVPAPVAKPLESSGRDPMLDALVVIAKAFGGAVRAGEVFVSVVLGVVLLVLALRVFGKKLHDAIPDDATGFTGWIESCLHFLFDTKPGGVLLNGLASSALSIGAIAATGTALTPEIVGLTAIGSGGVVGLAGALYGWGKDLYGWWKARKPDPAPAQAAGVAAAKDPGDTLNG